MKKTQFNIYVKIPNLSMLKIFMFMLLYLKYVYLILFKKNVVL